MVQSQFSLSWDSYKSNISTGFSSLQQNGELVDLTLAADGYFVKVHKVLLALSSPYLKELISSAPCQHPVIFLNNVSHFTLCLILEYIYTGEVIVPAKNLNSFMETAKSLHIKGLENVEQTKNKSDEMAESNCEPSISSISGVTRISRYNDELSLPVNAKRISIKQEPASNKLNSNSRRKSIAIDDNDTMQDSMAFDDTDIHDSEDNQVNDKPTNISMSIPVSSQLFRCDIMPRKKTINEPGVRKYGTISNYTQEKLEETLNKIRSGALSQRKACKMYKIPRSTINLKLKNKHNKPVGRPAYLTTNGEIIISD